jgi:type II secretory pathway component GspD/PulD (secretin)
MRVTNTEEQLAVLEDALKDLNATPNMIEVETRFVEVAQEDLNSLGFEWLLNSDYSFNVGGKLAKALNLKSADFNQVLTEGGEYLTDYNRTVETVTETTADGTISSTSTSVPIAGGASSTTSTSSDTTSSDGTARNVRNTLTQTYGWRDDTTGWGRSYKRGHQRHNMGVNAVDGDSYSTGMRYLSNIKTHLNGKTDSEPTNDQFMRVNAFLGNADLSMILHMLAQRSDTDLLSAPKVVTKSGQEATIKVVTIYRYPQDYDVTISQNQTQSSVTGGGGDTKILPMVEPQNFETQEVGVILTVTPELSSEGNFINLKLNPKVVSEPTWHDYGMKVPLSAVLGSAEAAIRATTSTDLEWFTVPMEQPFFKERSIDTVVTLYNGATVVMGGMITEERKSMEDKIPFLGDIPFLGRFFRSRSEWSNKRNLLLFVSARLVGPDGRMIQNSSGTTTTVAPAGNAPAEAAPAAEEK